MRIPSPVAAGCFATLLGLFLSACSGVSGNANGTQSPTTTYSLTVSSVSPATGVSISVTPADSSGATNGTTSFTRTYKAGTSITLTAPAATNGNSFQSWTGCTTTASGKVCNVTLNANTTVSATYNSSSTISGITVTPNTATIGAQVQFTATVTGSGTFSNAVAWSVAGAAGSSLSPGTIDSAGLYTTPYPA